MYGPFDAPQLEVESAERAFKEEHGRKPTDQELADFMTANHPAEAVDPRLVMKEEKEGEEVNEEVLNKVIADFKGLYNREPTDDELEDALNARAGKKDF